MKYQSRTLTAFFAFIVAAALIWLLWPDSADDLPATGQPTIAHGLAGIEESGTLHVLTVNAPTTYERRNGRDEGYEAELASMFAAELGVTPEFTVYDSLPALMDAIEAGEGHIAAAGLTRRERAGAEALFGPAYKNVRPRVVCHRDERLPQNVGELAGKRIAVAGGTLHDERLATLAIGMPGVEWQTRNVDSSMPLLADVSEGALDCTVADSHLLTIARRIYPDLAASFALTQEDQQLAWLVAPQSGDLMASLKRWSADIHRTGMLAELDERYFGHLDTFDYVDITVFRKRIDSRLPTYEPTFREAAGNNNLDWTLLAAQGYQESHWDPAARSPTGVRGLMMLTRPTARELGVSNRLDPQESIFGGAEYMDRLYNRLPDEVTGYDRLWMAMAAYNVGYGHLLDARRLAERQGLDKNVWSTIDDMLPLLTQKEYYRTVRHGYARGHEPVNYVRRIREYDDVLTANVDDPELPPFILNGREEPATPPEPGQNDTASLSQTGGAGLPGDNAAGGSMIADSEPGEEAP